MKTKTCTKCNNELLAELKNFHSMKNGKYGLRSVCKPCTKIARQKYTSTDAYKKKHRESMAKWRNENPEQQKKIRDKCYKKNSKRFNEERRERYNSDENYRKQRLLIDKKYTKSGRRKELYAEDGEKERLRSKTWRANNIDYVKESQDTYRKENAEKLHKMHVDNRKNLHPTYVAQCMRIKTKDLTPEVYSTKKIIIELKRELRNNNVKIR